MLWQRRDLRYLLNLIDHLPRDSFFSEAVAQDEDHARMLLAHPSSRGSTAYAPPLSTWSPEVELLTSILDAVQTAGIMSANVQGAKLPAPKPAPRPRTAVERLRTRAALEQHESLVARLTALREQGAPTMADVAETVIEVHHPPHGKVMPQNGVER